MEWNGMKKYGERKKEKNSTSIITADLMKRKNDIIIKKNTNIL